MASLADPPTVLEACNPESPQPGIRAWPAGVVRYKSGTSVSGRGDRWLTLLAPEYRNRLVSNVVLAVSVIPFIVVGVQEVLGSL